MNDEKLEEILRKSPRVIVPPGVLDHLQSQICLPSAAPSRADSFDARPWLRRWLPALSFAAFFVTCLVAIGIQVSILSELKRQNEALRISTQGISPLRAANEEYKRLQAQGQELERLRKDYSDLKRLRAEVGQLRGQLPEVEKLRADNQRLTTEIAARSGKSDPGEKPNDDFFAEAQAKAERIQCVNNLKQIGLAGRIWAGDNNDRFPLDFLSMTNELNTPVILKCPADKARSVTNWAEVAAGNVSYQMDAPGSSEAENPDTVFVECPIHHNLLLIDGSVQQTSLEFLSTHLKVVNGRKVLVR
ncbi:MAG: hypothetical protein JWR69_2362 [Pedosphaera sp.]|nr:hypothetical protein [Pedosphaera sp.]